MHVDLSNDHLQKAFILVKKIAYKRQLRHFYPQPYNTLYTDISATNVTFRRLYLSPIITAKDNIDTNDENHPEM